MRTKSKHRWKWTLEPAALAQGAWGAFWLGVAALHVWLFARRLWAGQWDGGLDQLRLGLSLAGAIYAVYATFRIGAFLRKIQASPRRVFCALLLFVVGHLAVAPPGSGNFAPPEFENSASSLVFVLPIAIGGLLIGLALSRRLRHATVLPIHNAPAPAADPKFQNHCRWVIPQLANRPPPCRL